MVKTKEKSIINFIQITPVIIKLLIILLILGVGITIVIYSKNSVKKFSSKYQSSCDKCNKDEEECEINYERQPYIKGMPECKTDNDCISLRGSTGTYKCKNVDFSSYSRDYTKNKTSYNSCSQLNGVRCTQGSKMLKDGLYVLGGLLIAIGSILLIIFYYNSKNYLRYKANTSLENYDTHFTNALQNIVNDNPKLNKYGPPVENFKAILGNKELLSNFKNNYLNNYNVDYVSTKLIKEDLKNLINNNMSPS